MDPLMIIIMEILRACCVENHCYLLMVKFFNLIQASTWYLLMVKLLLLFLEM